MSKELKRYTYKNPVVSGSLLPPKTFTITIGGDPPPLELVEVNCQLRKRNVKGEMGPLLSTTNNTITIDDATAWRFVIGGSAITADPSEWVGQVDYIDTNGVPRTDFEVVITILEDGT